VSKVPDGMRCIICREPAVKGKIKHRPKPFCPGERKMSVLEAEVTGGNFKNVITIHFPGCGTELDLKRPKGNPPTVQDIAQAAIKHRETCNECK